jgi:hypothetical protein
MTKYVRVRGLVEWIVFQQVRIPHPSSLCANVPKLIVSRSFRHFDFGMSFGTVKQPFLAVFRPSEKSIKNARFWESHDKGKSRKF